MRHQAAMPAGASGAEAIAAPVAVIGARSLVGAQLLPLLTQQGRSVLALSRRTEAPSAAPEMGGLRWQSLTELDRAAGQAGFDPISHWLVLAPIWHLPDYFALLQRCGARRLVALSSTSRFSKAASSDAGERALAARLAEAEEQLQHWATLHGVTWVILRPTLIYGYGRDQNIARLARLIRRFGWFPLLGEGRGLRQPVHVDDVAAACFSALLRGDNRAYNLSGAEVLSYRALVERVFMVLQRQPRFVTVPLPLVRLVLPLVRQLPRYRDLTCAMAERMEQDLVFDHSAACRDLGFAPRAFEPQDVV